MRARPIPWRRSLRRTISFDTSARGGDEQLRAVAECREDGLPVGKRLALGHRVQETDGGASLDGVFEEAGEGRERFRLRWGRGP